MDHIGLGRTRNFVLQASVILAFIIPSFGFPLVYPSVQLTALAQSDDAVMRSLVERYFAAYGRKDLAVIESLWSGKSPYLAKSRQNLEQQFKTTDLSFSGPEIKRVKVEGGSAGLRATIALTSVNLKSQLKNEQRLTIAFEFVKEGEQWKVWRYAPAAEDLAEALAKISSKAERAELLAAEKDLITPELWEALLTQGQRLINQGRYAPAGEIYELSLANAEQFGDKKGIAQALRGVGTVRAYQGSYAQALELFQRALRIWEEIGDKKGIADTMSGFAFVQLRQGQYTQALEQSLKNLKAYEELGDKVGIASTQGLIGSIYDQLGDYPRAMGQYQSYLKLSEEIGNQNFISGALNNIGSIFRRQGDNPQAIEMYQKSLKISEDLGDREGAARSLNNIGIVYLAQGDYAKSLKYTQKCLEIREEVGNRFGVAGALLNIGLSYYGQGSYPQAIEQYQRSLKISEEIGDKAGIARTWNNIGVVHLLQDNHSQALDEFQKSLKIREGLMDRAGIASTLDNIGIIFQEQGEYAQALERHQRSLKIKEEIGDKPGIVITLHNIGKIHYTQGDHLQALQFATRAADLTSQIGYAYGLWDARTLAGKAYLSLNQPAKARLSFEQAIDSIEALRANVAGGEQEQQQFFESKVEPYCAMVDLLIAENRPGEALTYAERAKARVLLDVFSSGRAGVTQSMTDLEIQQERELLRHLASLNKSIFQEKQRQQADQDRLNQLGSQLQKARLDLESFETNLYTNHPGLRARRGDAPPLRGEQAAALPPDDATALLEFVVSEMRTYLFILTKAVPPAVKVYKLETSEADLKERIERFRHMISTSDNRFSEPARDLYDLLLKPAEAELQGKNRLVIVPDGSLWELPFQALQISQRRYLIDDYAISYTPSLTVMREMINARHSKEIKSFAASTLLALGNPALDVRTAAPVKSRWMGESLDPLPEAERQVRTLGKIYGPGRSKIYVGGEAREERFKSDAKNFRILHLATHGILDDRRPMYSYLVLAQTGEMAEEDGMLEAWELMKMDLKADLVVLSACETARGRVGKGEGMIGMTWALFVAGAPTTVVSQWKVRSDSTAELMVAFHRRLSASRTGSSGRNAAEALRSAALKLKSDSRYRHPFHWAGFIVVGDGY